MEDTNPHPINTFGWAVKSLQNGHKLQRAGWNGKGMYLFYVGSNGYYITSTAAHPEPNRFDNLPFIAMKTADNKVVPWLASQTDMLALDWSVVE